MRQKFFNVYREIEQNWGRFYPDLTWDPDLVAADFPECASERLELTLIGADEISYSIVDYDVTCRAKLDGKDYPVLGKNVTDGLTLSFSLSRPDCLEMVEKFKGKEIFRCTFIPTDGGKSLISDGAAS